MHTVTDYERIVEIHALANQPENVMNLLALFDTSYSPQTVPDHFVPGPLFVAITADVDCDGTGYAAHGIAAPNLATAKIEADRICANYSGWSVMTVPEFRSQYGEDKLRDLFDEPLWERDGVSVFYASLGADWNQWVYDDTIGIPALDHRLDD